MEQNCENLASCSFFEGFGGNTEVVKNGWIQMFCRDKEKSERCKRKQMKKNTGNPPPPNMAPTGNLIST